MFEVLPLFVNFLCIQNDEVLLVWLILQVVGIVGFMDHRLDIPEHLDPKLVSVMQDCWRRQGNHVKMLVFSRR